MIENDHFNLTGKTALITGASSGLGRQFAYCLSKAGARVILCSRQLEKLKLIAKDLSNAIPMQLDVTNESNIKSAISSLEKSGERIDVCISAAGIASYSPIFDLNDNSFEEIQKINVLGLWYVTKAIANHMKTYQIKGSIINMGSVSGDALPAPKGAGYCASKASVHQITKSLVSELSKNQIRINTLSTWMIPTPMTEGFLESNQESIEKMTPLGLGKIDDLDAAILFLSSNRASRYMTGSCLTIDGGISYCQQ